MTTEAKHIVHLRHPLVLLGIPLYYLNDYTDTHLNIPAAEFAFLGLIAWQWLTRPALLISRAAITASVLAALLVVWMAIVDVYHGEPLGHGVRVFMRTGMFYAIILGYLLLPDKTQVLRLVTGFMVGFILNFFGATVLTIVQDSSMMWLLKYILPTPAVILFMLMQRRYLSRNLQWLMLGYLAFTLIAMPFIGSRGAFLSLAVGLGFYALARPAFVRKSLIILLALYLPFLPVTIVGMFYEPGNPYTLTDWLFSIDYATLSNVERTLMVYTNIEGLQESPLVGIGVGEDIRRMAPYYLSITNQTHTTAESPHNYYMEIAVPFGLPPLMMALGVWFILYRQVFASMAREGMRRGAAAFCCGAIAWIMLYQPVSGITRMDVFAIMMFGLYGLRQQQRHREERSDVAIQ